MANLLSNKYVSGFVSILIALYAVFVAPALPNQVLHFFDTPIGRLLFIFLVAWLASEGNTQVALMVSIALTITLMALEKKTLEESFIQNAREHFQDISDDSTDNTSSGEGDASEPQGVVSSEMEGAPVSEEMETSYSPVNHEESDSSGVVGDLGAEEEESSDSRGKDSHHHHHHHHHHKHRKHHKHHHHHEHDLSHDNDTDSSDIPADGGANLLGKGGRIEPFAPLPTSLTK